MAASAAAASSSAHTAAAASSAARPAAAGTAATQSCSPISLIQWLAARSLGLHSTHLRLTPRSSVRPKRKAIIAELESDEVPPAAAQRTLLPIGSFPPGFFLRPLRPEQLSLIWARPPVHQRFRLQSLFDEQRYPRIREHVFLAFDRSGTMLISYSKSEPNAAASSSEEQDQWADDRSASAAASLSPVPESGYTLCFWLFTPPAPLRLVSSIPLFRSLAHEGSRARSADDYLRAQLGVGSDGEDEHHYIQMQESTDSSCFVLAAAKVDPTETPGAGVADQSSKVHVSIIPSPLQPNHASLPQIHFSFVSSIRVPSLELVTIAAPFSTQPAQHCLLINGVDTVQCVQLCMQLATPPSPSALSDTPSPPILDDLADHMLRRTSSLLSAAITRVDWLSDLTVVDARGCLPPSASASSSPLLPPWTLECEVFVRDLCVGVSRRLENYGLAAVRCEGFRTSAVQSRTMLLIVETESSAQSLQPHVNRTRFEALLLVWNLERLHDVERVPLSWTTDYMQRLLRAHKVAYASSSLSDADRISQAGAHEIAKSLARPISASMRRIPVNNFPLFSKRSRQLLLNPALPLALLL